MKTYDKQYINGEWREGTGEQRLENRNPYTNEVIYTYQAAGKQDVDAAYAAAAKAQEAWAQTTPAHKQEMLCKLIDALEDLRDEIKATSTEEGGGVFSRGMVECDNSIKITKGCMNFPLMMDGKIMPSNIPGKENYVYKMPLGVIGVIAPWNMPYGLAMRSVVPAIATGNAVVLKPSTETPASGFVIAQAFERAGFPKGLFNVVAGKGSEIGDYFVAHETPELISFTGSTEIGKNVGRIASENLKGVALELGGNNAMIVLNDADVQAAVRSAVFAKFTNAGQICMALSRVICLPQVYDAFLTAFVQAAQFLPVGNPADPSVAIGPLMNTGQIKNCETLIQGSLEAGASVALEGKTEGNVMFPWVLGEVTGSMPTAKYETFGPICNVMRAQSVEEAITIANDTPYGLSASVFTEDICAGVTVARRLNVGMAHVNDQTINDEPHVMFGGNKDSGVGRFNAQWAVDKFTTEQWISVQAQGRF